MGSIPIARGLSRSRRETTREQSSSKKLPRISPSFRRPIAGSEGLDSVGLGTFQDKARGPAVDRPLTRSEPANGAASGAGFMNRDRGEHRQPADQPLPQ